jgi:heme/copper-type cytochrome/quinol oxidase subunit 2
MFSTLRRLLVLAAGTVASAMLFAPVAFAVNDGDSAAGGPNPSTTTTHHAAAGSSLATWQWTLISIGIVVAVAGIVAAAMTLHRRTKRTGTLQPHMP